MMTSRAPSPLISVTPLICVTNRFLCTRFRQLEIRHALPARGVCRNILLRSLLCYSAEDMNVVVRRFFVCVCVVIRGSTAQK